MFLYARTKELKKGIVLKISAHKILIGNLYERRRHNRASKLETPAHWLSAVCLSWIRNSSIHLHP